MMDEPVFVELVDDAIDMSRLLGLVADPDVGAHGWFCGVTRKTTRKTSDQPKITSLLSYEAHRPMAVSELQALARKSIEKFGLTFVVIVHRLGVVPIGEASVVVGCSSPHRDATFDALRWIMQTLKREVPIWKQETFADGSTEWVHPTPDTEAGAGA